MALNKDVPRLSRDASTPAQNLIKTQRWALEGGEVVIIASLLAADAEVRFLNVESKVRENGTAD